MKNQKTLLCDLAQSIQRLEAKQKATDEALSDLRVDLVLEQMRDLRDTIKAKTHRAKETLKDKTEVTCTFNQLVMICWATFILVFVVVTDCWYWLK